jgi:hypothetical protein
VRARSLKKGRLELNKTSTRDCLVRNVSPKGALILLPSLVGIPERFTLVLGEERKRHACRVARRGREEIGVEFLV